MKIPDSTNLVAGAIAIREGVKYILENQFSHTIIEFDSLAMVNMIEGVWETTWSVTIEANSIIMTIHYVLS